MLVGVLRFELKASASRTQRATICAIPRRKTAAYAAVWLRKKDSNPHNASQSRRCYHYTIPHQIALLLYKNRNSLSIPFCKKFCGPLFGQRERFALAEAACGISAKGQSGVAGPPHTRFAERSRRRRPCQSGAAPAKKVAPVQFALQRRNAAKAARRLRKKCAVCYNETAKRGSIPFALRKGLHSVCMTICTQACKRDEIR